MPKRRREEDEPIPVAPKLVGLHSALSSSAAAAPVALSFQDRKKRFKREQQEGTNAADEEMEKLSGDILLNDEFSSFLEPSKLSIDFESFLEGAKTTRNLTPKEIDHINRNCTPPITHNIVFSLHFDTTFDIPDLAWKTCGAHVPKFRASACIHIKEPRCTALIFSSGACIITGTKTQDAAVLAAISLSRFISDRLGKPVRYRDLVSRNRMATVYLGYTVDNVRFYADHPEYVNEEEAFRAIKIAMPNGGMVLLFKTGSFVICGPKSPAEAMRIRDEVIRGVAAYKDRDMSRQELEELKRKEEKKANAIRSLDRIVKVFEETLHNHEEKRKMYSKVSDPALAKYVNLEDIKLGYCFTPRKTQTECEHYVFVKWKGREWRGICKMRRSRIVRLFVQNGFQPPPHDDKLTESGSPGDKKRPMPNHKTPERLPPNWVPSEEENRLLTMAGFWKFNDHLATIREQAAQ